jgi:hypothetical protein
MRSKSPEGNGIYQLRFLSLQNKNLSVRFLDSSKRETSLTLLRVTKARDFCLCLLGVGAGTRTPASSQMPTVFQNLISSKIRIRVSSRSFQKQAREVKNSGEKQTTPEFRPFRYPVEALREKPTGKFPERPEFRSFLLP